MGKYFYREYVENKAVEFLLHYAESYPLNVFDLAKKVYCNHIKPYSVFTEDVIQQLENASKDGFTYSNRLADPWDYDYNILFYNDKQHPLRQKFTIMHDTGHVILGHHQSSRLAEDEADYFAEYCLAPKVLIDILQIKSAEEIQFVFHTSSPCTKTIWAHYIQWLNHRKSEKIHYTTNEKNLVRQFYPQIKTILNYHQILYSYEKRRLS